MLIKSAKVIAMDGYWIFPNGSGSIGIELKQLFINGNLSQKIMI